MNCLQNDIQLIRLHFQVGHNIFTQFGFQRISAHYHSLASTRTSQNVDKTTSKLKRAINFGCPQNSYQFYALSPFALPTLILVVIIPILNWLHLQMVSPVNGRHQYLHGHPYLPLSAASSPISQRALDYIVRSTYH